MTLNKVVKSCFCNTALCEWLHQCVYMICFLMNLYCLHTSQVHLFANLTCRARPEGFWLRRSGPPRRWESHWAACGWLARRNGHCAAGPWWSSAGSWPMRSACETESSDSRSPARNSRGREESKFLSVWPACWCLFSAVTHPKHFYHCGGFGWHFSVKTKSAGRGRHLVALQTHVRRETADPSTLPHSPPAVTSHVEGLRDVHYYPEQRTARAGLWASVTSQFSWEGRARQEGH